MSLDALRGFDMFWIVGADSLVEALHRMTPGPVTRFLGTELDHVDWKGFHFEDLIFPMFVFMAGVSIVFSLGRTIEQRGLGAALWRVVRRSALLYFLGIIYYGGFAHPFSGIRLMGVLQLIGLAYLIAGLTFCFLHRRPAAMAAVCGALLLGHWAVVSFVPFPDVRPTPGGDAIIAKETGFTNVAQLNFASTTYLQGSFLKGVSLPNYVDQKYLPGMKWDGTWDPEGLMTPITGGACCLLGVFAGLLLQGGKTAPRRKVLCLLACGAAAVALGWLWNFQLPVIKKIWSASFILVAAGYATMLLAVFYFVVDVLGWRKWCQPFVWIGMNPITIYLVANVIDEYTHVAERFAGGDIEAFFNTQVAQGLGNLIVALLGLALAFGFAHFLYRKKVFIRL